MAYNVLSGGNCVPTCHSLPLAPPSASSEPHRTAFPLSHERRTGRSRPLADPQMLCRLAALLAARHLGCPVETVVSETCREAPVAAARQLAMYLAHVGLGLSQHQVAVGFGRDRRTVSHACNRVEDRRDDGVFDAFLTDVEAQLRWAAGR